MFDFSLPWASEAQRWKKRGGKNSYSKYVFSWMFGLRNLNQSANVLSLANRKTKRTSRSPAQFGVHCVSE